VFPTIEVVTQRGIASAGFPGEAGGGGCIEPHSHFRASLVSDPRASLDRYRRRRVRTTRCIALPQKQVGSARFDVAPIIRKRICAPQIRLGHSHHSSRLFFTNATSARFNAPRRCTCPMRAPSDTGQPFQPRGACRPYCCIGDNLALGSQPSRKKMISAHDCDRCRRGWFSSQDSRLFAGKRLPGATSCRVSVLIQPSVLLLSSETHESRRFRPEKPRFRLTFGVPNCIHCNVIFVVCSHLYRHPQIRKNTCWKFFRSSRTLVYRGRFPYISFAFWLEFQPLLFLFSFFFVSRIPSPHS
jgi:hypothetical protein